MKISLNPMKNKCDIGGCPNIAEYTISENEQNKKHAICFCSECLKKLYSCLGKLYTPKSPRNKFNNTSKSELRKIFEKGEK